MANYRRVPPPPSDLEGTDGYVSWAVHHDLLRSVGPRLHGACDLCFGAVGFDYDGDPFSTCWRCTRFSAFIRTDGGGRMEPVLDGVVPVTYSVTEGFESLLQAYKQQRDTSIGRDAIVGSVLSSFLTRHLECIESSYGPITILTAAPPRLARAFAPMEAAISFVRDWPRDWDLGLLCRTTDAAHSRGEMDGSYYDLGPGRSVVGETVLVVDDTWTSGATLASIARRLREEGAAGVVGLPLGRQINSSSSFGTSPALYQQIVSRPWTSAECVLCAPPNPKAWTIRLDVC